MGLHATSHLLAVWTIQHENVNIITQNMSKKLYTHNRRAHPLRQYLTLKFPIQHEGWLQCMMYWFISSLSPFVVGQYFLSSFMERWVFLRIPMYEGEWCFPFITLDILQGLQGWFLECQISHKQSWNNFYVENWADITIKGLRITI